MTLIIKENWKIWPWIIGFAEEPGWRSLELGGISSFPGPRIQRASQVQESLGLDSEICIFNEHLRQYLVNGNISLVANKLPNFTLDEHKKQPESGDTKVTIQRGISGTSRSPRAQAAS